MRSHQSCGDLHWLWRHDVRPPISKHMSRTASQQAHHNTDSDIRISLVSATERIIYQQAITNITNAIRAIRVCGLRPLRLRPATAVRGYQSASQSNSYPGRSSLDFLDGWRRHRRHGGNSHEHSPSSCLVHKLNHCSCTTAKARNTSCYCVSIHPSPL